MKEDGQITNPLGPAHSPVEPEKQIKRGQETTNQPKDSIINSFEVKMCHRFWDRIYTGNYWSIVIWM